MQRYKKKPDVVEAIIWTGDNIDEVKKWLKTPMVDMLIVTNRHLIIPNMDGTRLARPNDYLVRDNAGKLFPCHPDKFANLYEATND